MKKYKHFLYLPFVLCGLFAFTFQTNGWSSIDNAALKTAFTEIEKAYEKNNNYSVDVEHISYENHLSQIEGQRVKGFYKQNGSNSHEYIVGIHTVQNSKYRVVINDEEKTILIASPVKHVFTGTQQMDTKLLDAALSGIKHKKESEEEIYRIEFKPGAFLKAYELFLNADKMVTRLRMFMEVEVKTNPKAENSAKTKPRMEIVYSNFKKGAKIDYSENFDEKKYFTEKGNKLSKTDAYKDYELIDTRLK